MNEVRVQNRFAPPSGERKNRRRAHESGSIAPLMLGLMVVMLTIALGIFSLSEAQSKFVMDDSKRLAALNLAEAGVERIVWRLRQPSDVAGNYGPFWRNVALERDVQLASGTYYLTSMDENTAGVRGLRIQGCIPRRTALNAVCSELYVEVAPIYMKPWSGAALGDTGVPVANGGTDSFKSSEGPYGTGPIYQNGDVATNNTAAGSISIGSNGTVQGKAYYPPTAGATVVSGADRATGGAAPNPATTEFVSIPPIPPTAIYLQPYDGKVLKTLDGTVLSQPLLPGVYVFRANGNKKSIEIKGTDSLLVAGTGQTVFYLDGDAEIAGNGIVNSTALPPNLLIYGRSTNNAASPPIPGCLNIDIGGNGHFHGAIYAPQASISLNGGGSNGSVSGSLAGKSVTFNGNGTVIHYDESLRELAGVIRAYRLNTWTQLK
ncbi:MAG: hypothetical protein KY468_07640 [Armatimonadetes bacterium]|nr:hypothetical protein [Armatimonadota bacterium]